MRPIVLLLAVALVCDAAPLAHATAQRAQADTLQTSIDLSRRTAIVRAAATVAPAVVSVNVVRQQRETAASQFDFFFVPRGYERMVQGFGSGFIVSADGVIITNQHVIQGATQIVVTTRDGKDYPARLLGQDPLTDIAVLKVDASSLPTVRVGHSTDLMVGEWVVAFGNPYAYLLGNTEPSVTTGVVSASGRNLLPSGDQPGVYVGMIQTDAAINPGNSGGPLANAVGEVVGVNSSIFSNTGGSVGIGFAIPIERALRVADELRKHGSVRRAFMGLDVAGPEELQDWKRSGGLKVTAVAPGGPADRAGVKSGDVLKHAGGHELRTFLDWEEVKLDVGPGDSIRLQYQRGGSDRSGTLIVEDLPTATAARVALLGNIEVVTVTPAIRVERGIRSERGALILTLGEDTRRATALRTGDVIVRIGRQVIQNAEEADRALRDAAGQGWVRVLFERGGQVRYVDLSVR